MAEHNDVNTVRPLVCQLAGLFRELQESADLFKKQGNDEACCATTACAERLREIVLEFRKHTATLATSAVGLIAVERVRQLGEERWTAEHDDGHTDGQLAQAAACYALATVDNIAEGGVSQVVDELWPFEEEWFKYDGDKVRALTKAGALVAAEIDRLLRDIVPK